MRSVVFDSFAILAWLQEEEGMGFVDRLLWRVGSGELSGGICVINLGEVYYIVAKERGLAQAEMSLANLQELDWLVYPVGEATVLTAARLKARFPISYADAFALACAQEHGASLVTGDPEILKASHGIPVLWPGIGETPEEQPVEQ